MAQSVTDDRPTTVAHPWWALVSLLIGLSMIIIDGSIVNVLLPDMVEDLGLTQTDAQWVNSIYSLLFAALLITVGAAGRQVRAAPALPVRHRGVPDGIAGERVGPGPVLPDRRPSRPGDRCGHDAAEFDRGHPTCCSRGANGRSPSACGGGVRRRGGLGPLLGGWLAEDFSWRWAFLVNIPVGIIAAIMVMRTVPENHGPGQGLRPGRGPAVRDRPRPSSSTP